jgi:hypothetical protein
MLLTVLLSASAYSQQAPPGSVAASPVDPPGRVARLSYTEGSVSLQPAGVDDWTAAGVNRPLTAGDQLWSAHASRAEIQLASAAIRLGENTVAMVLTLSDSTLQLRLSAGTAGISLRSLETGTWFEIDAPNAAISVLQPGRYRINVDAAGATTVALRSGRARIVGSSGQSISLQGGQAMRFMANGATEVVPLGLADDFERWCDSRERRATSASRNAQFFPSDTVGAQELEDYGQWSVDPDYGELWYPDDLPQDWAPYRYGSWLWVAPWGWTWVDEAPWGFAPFHYGRWTYRNRRWGWAPPTPGNAAIYAPATVAWIGGRAVGDTLLAAGGLGIGWLPLAPGEVAVPAYGVSLRYLETLNRNNSAGISARYVERIFQNPALQGRYANRVAPYATSVTSIDKFTSGRLITAWLIAPPPSWRDAAAVPLPPSVAPRRQSVLGLNDGTRASRPPAGISDRSVIAQRPPAPAVVALERQLDALHANGDRPLTLRQQLRLRSTEPGGNAIIFSRPPPSTEPAPPPAGLPRMDVPMRAAQELQQQPVAPAALPVDVPRTQPHRNEPPARAQHEAPPP